MKLYSLIEDFSDKFSLLVVMLSALGLFAGCSGNNDDENNSTVIMWESHNNRDITNQVNRANDKPTLEGE